MNRLELIQWLTTNDPNGVYSDADSKREGMTPLTKKEGLKIAVRQSKGY